MMQVAFSKPTSAIGRFAIVRLWPDINNAEVECTSRLKIAAAALGLECIEIHSDGRLLDDPGKIIRKTDVDFVLHLHYDTPKLYDAFSFVALWNPVYFYHEWGYTRTSRNLLTHDDFVSCSSTAADNHLGRLIRHSATHLPPAFNLYHSVADIVHAPSLGDRKLFYAGINWDALRGGISRHQELLKHLDKTGNLRIFGPAILLNVNIWSGYESYVREIPFDGVSMIDEISRAGIALVLSSQAHKDSELMSNRLFESIAAGALVICDENKFAKKFFGDCLLYIDSRCAVERIYEDIQSHLAWAEANPDKALAMIKKSQDILLGKFSLIRNLSDLYLGLSDRKQKLLARQLPENSTPLKVRLYLLMPVYCVDILDAHIASAVAQEYKHFTPVLVIDRRLSEEVKSSIAIALRKSNIQFELSEIDFSSYGIHEEIKTRRRLGEAIGDILKTTSSADAVVFVAPNEKIFSNHLQVLAGSLARQPNKNCAATVTILLRVGRAVHDVHEKIDFRQLDPAAPIGYARFIFRVSALPDDLNLTLPYVDRKAMAILVGESEIVREIPSTVLLYVDQEFPSGLWDEGQENELIGSYCPAAFTVSTGHEIVLPSLSYPPPPAPAPPPQVVTVAAPVPQPLESSLMQKTRAIKRIIGYVSWPFFVQQIGFFRQGGIAGRFEALRRELNS